MDFTRTSVHDGNPSIKAEKATCEHDELKKFSTRSIQNLQTSKREIGAQIRRRSNKADKEIREFATLVKDTFRSREEELRAQCEAISSNALQTEKIVTSHVVSHLEDETGLRCPRLELSGLTLGHLDSCIEIMRGALGNLERTKQELERPLSIAGTPGTTMTKETTGKKRKSKGERKEHLQADFKNAGEGIVVRRRSRKFIGWKLRHEEIFLEA